ncbi:hypothetical protein B0T18DRAFT_443792 [Schizothecium vesticola]|uniref:Uncharacterized protein n=1 Tax=Schizothecium vesticola TaxID=314040 RepID=A0AA40F4V2_9PEZI|nr:hypothetical protein B0T18DRAFT_443792 [Schizothecium vesticola]
MRTRVVRYVRSLAKPPWQGRCITMSWAPEPGTGRTVRPGVRAAWNNRGAGSTDFKAPASPTSRRAMRSNCFPTSVDEDLGAISKRDAARNVSAIRTAPRRVLPPSSARIWPSPGLPAPGRLSYAAASDELPASPSPAAAEGGKEPRLSLHLRRRHVLLLAVRRNVRVLPRVPGLLLLRLRTYRSRRHSRVGW